MANSERIYLIQGNDTDMSVCLRKGGDTPLPYDLTGASRIGLALTGHGLSFFARDIEVSGEDNNIISGLLAGDLLVGEYGLEVSFTLDGKAKRFRVPQVFEVVTYLSEDQDGTAEGEGDGISITVTVQPELIEISGPTGPRGKSAYEVWIAEGHTGDEDDFFRWLAAQTPNPDWAQNDASEPDYVENRTHYDIPAVSLPDAFITFQWTEEDYSDLMFYLNDETPMPRVSENTWGVQLGQWLLSCYINGNVLEVDLDGDPILTVANFRPGRTPQPILVGDIEVPELVQQLDGKYLGLKTVNGQSVKGSGDIALNGGNLEYTGNDGEYISGGDSINSSLLLLDEAVNETNGRLDNLKGSQVVYDGEDGDSVIVHGETVDQCLKELDDQAAYIIDHYQYKIPDLDTIREGAAAGATAYQKPSTGIPKSALASAVKTSLEKADTALQPSALNGYATEDYVDEEVSGKQDTLISGENIKTINGQSVLGSGDIQTGGGSADAVKYTEQELIEAQQEQARTNIAAASESEVSQLRSDVEYVVESQPATRIKQEDFSLSGIYKATDSTISPNASYHSTPLITVEPGDVIEWVDFPTTNDASFVLCCYDAQESPVSQGSNNRVTFGYIKNTLKFTVPAGVYKLGFTWNTGTYPLTSASVAQIGEDTVAITDDAIQEISERLGIDTFTSDGSAEYYLKGNSSIVYPSSKKLGIIAAGQSNIDGRNSYSDLPADFVNPNAKVRFCNNKNGVFADFQITDGGQNNDWSFDAIVYDLLTKSAYGNQSEIYVMKKSMGGTSIDPLGTSEYHWTADYEFLDNPSHSLLLDFETTIRKGVELQGSNFDIKAMLWHQGEGDTHDEGVANRYYSNLKNMLAYVRGVVGNPRLYFFCGNIPVNRVSPDYVSIINSAYARLASEDPYFKVVDMSNAQLEDGYHFNYQWSIYFGQKVYDLMIDAGIISGTKINPSEPS